MERWQLRILEERDELEVKLRNLNQFLRGCEETTDTVSYEEKYRLEAQKDAMTDYHRALCNRILNFEVKNEAN